MLSDILQVNGLYKDVFEVNINEYRFLFIDDGIAALKDPRTGMAFRCTEPDTHFPQKVREVLEFWIGGSGFFMAPANVEEYLIPAALRGDRGPWSGQYPEGYPEIESQIDPFCEQCEQRHDLSVGCPSFS